MCHFPPTDLDNKPKRYLRNLPVQHMYQRMPDDEASIEKQLDLLKNLDLSHILLASNSDNAAEYLGKVSN